MARYMVAEEFHGTKWYTVKWYGFLKIIRFLNRYMVARDHGIPMVSLTAVKTAVNNRGKFTV